MKLRIDREKISFRLDLDEVEKLLNLGELQAETPLPDGVLSYRITCLAAGSAPGFQATGTAFSLHIARDVIEAHIAALPSLQGIVCDFPAQDGTTLNVALEINLKKKLKRSLDLKSPKDCHGQE